ncbi:DUF4390 domain-containing protein [Methylomarinum vadi]|uniref:DUF4390 domain-containing protein n=1 Tax=Methylomarinum vadi TaxID=438855 RepID=UPI0004DF76A6|nr:DUF4390 domain-containing protein [Methylomarinum vadi]
MPKSVKPFKTAWLLLLLLPALASAADFAAGIENIAVQREGGEQVLLARIDYRLSPKAKEAIYKGVPLSWVLLIKLQRRYWFWHYTVHERRIPYVIRYEALLNQFSVKNLLTEHVEMFATLNIALGYMAAVREPIWPEHRLHLAQDYSVAVKVQFDREFLPIPLRPESYFDPQWALSSDWFIWHPRK